MAKPATLFSDQTYTKFQRRNKIDVGLRCNHNVTRLDFIQLCFIVNDTGYTLGNTFTNAGNPT